MKISLRQLLSGVESSRDWYAAVAETLQEAVTNEERIAALEKELAGYHERERERFVWWLDRVTATSFDPRVREDWSDRFGRWVYEDGKPRRIE